MNALFPAALAMALAACTPVQPVGEAPDQSEDLAACGADDLQYLVGQPRSVLTAMTFPRPTRVIGPNMAVTMDFNPERLNIRYNEQGTIVAVECG